MTGDYPNQPAKGMLWNGCLAGYWLAMMALLHLPIPPKTDGSWEHLDKVAHFGLYAVLTFLAAGALDALAHRSSWISAAANLQRSVLVLAAILLQGLFDELTQPLTGRTFDWWDLAADMSGGALALALFAACFWRTGMRPAT